MPLSLYAATIPSNLQMLGAVAKLVDKAEAWCSEHALPAAELIEAKLAAAVGPLPAKVERAQLNGDRVIFRIGPAHFWLVEPSSGTTPARLDGVGAVISLATNYGATLGLD